VKPKQPSYKKCVVAKKAIEKKKREIQKIVAKKMAMMVGKW